MFDFLKWKKKASNTQDKQDYMDDSITIASSITAMEVADNSVKQATQKYFKPEKYDRTLLDDGAAKKNIKKEAFANGVRVKDPYTGNTLTLTKAEAKERYGDEWTKHLAETDHKIPLEQRYEETKNNPWLTNEDIKTASNSNDNLEVVSRSFNNAKRSRTNENFVSDDKYLKKTGVKLSKEGKTAAIKKEKETKRALKKIDRKNTIKNIANTGYESGFAGAVASGEMTLTMSGITNIVSVIKGEKQADEAVNDIVRQSGKAAVSGFAVSSGVTVVTHSLSNSSSKFISALGKSNVPGNVVTTVMLIGDTLNRYDKGEITTQECLLELGEKGVNVAVTGQAMVVGQALIPIPVVGAAVGALVGSALTSKYYSKLADVLRSKELERQERQNIILEYKAAASHLREYRAELENYLNLYFVEYQECFDEALSEIHNAFKNGDIDGIILGANQITRKLGGTVYYDNVNEFAQFLVDDAVDYL